MQLVITNLTEELQRAANEVGSATAKMDKARAALLDELKLEGHIRELFEIFPPEKLLDFVRTRVLV